MDLSSKEYPKAFLLEPTKLERLLEVMHDRLAGHPNTTMYDQFQVFMAGNRCDELKSLEQVLALENSKKYRIERLLIVSAASTDRVLRPEYEIQVDFGVVKPPKGATMSAPVRLVTVAVTSDAPTWNRQTLSQVEEQVERTWLRQTTPVVSLLSLILLLAVFFLFQLGPVVRTNSSNTWWLDDKELDRIQQIVNENRSMTDAEFREIATGQLRNILLYERPKTEPQNGRKRLLLLFGIPFLLLVAVSLILAFTCYPNAVFLWGDEAEHYNAILQRRKLLWSLIISILVVSVLGKLLSEGVLSWIPK